MQSLYDFVVNRNVTIQMTCLSHRSICEPLGKTETTSPWRMTVLYFRFMCNAIGKQKPHLLFPLGWGYVVIIFVLTAIFLLFPFPKVREKWLMVLSCFVSVANSLKVIMNVPDLEYDSCSVHACSDRTRSKTSMGAPLDVITDQSDCRMAECYKKSSA